MLVGGRGGTTAGGGGRSALVVGASWEKHTVRSEENDAGKEEKSLLGAAILTRIGWEDGASYRVWLLLSIFSSPSSSSLFATITRSLLSEITLPHKRAIIHAPAAAFTYISSKQYGHRSQL